MNKSCMLIVVFLVLLLFSCGPELNESVEITDDDAGTEGQLLTVDLPFEVHTYTPEGEAYIVSFNPGQSVLFYYWIPLILQEEFESDIQYLAGLDDSSLAVIPVQLDTASRDQAQRIINEMNISLPVYQTDNTFYNRYGTGEIPFTVYIVPGEEPRLETGFGSPERILSIPEE